MSWHLALLAGSTTLPLLAQRHDAAQTGDAGGSATSPVQAASNVGASQSEVPAGRLVPADQAEAQSLWQIPIHSAAADPTGGQYGAWAGGLTFKVSFHDGFAFYPFLGPDYPENLPLRWTTESVTAGGQPLLTPGHAPAHEHSAWRYDYRHGEVTERYDVRAEGVEQMFVIHRRPATAGDLVVTGRVDTKLRSVGTVGIASAHRKLVFADDRGNPLVEYGAAIAFDAAGRRTEVSTSFDGSRVQLTVSGSWLAGASYPVTIDPLTARVVVSTWGGATFGLSSYPEVGRDDENNQLMVFYARQFSATDFDGYARLTDDNFVNVAGLVFTDITTSWSTGRAGVCFVGGANRWVLCLERDFPATAANTVRARVYFHDAADTTLNSGVVVFHDPTGETTRVPSVGGTAGFSGGLEAMLVYQGDVTATKANTVNSRIWALPINASTRTFGTRFEVDTFAGSDDCELPDINQISDGGSASWIVAYQRLDNAIASDDWDVQCARVTTAHTVAGNFFMGSAGGLPKHKLTPQVSGRGGRYMCSMIRSDVVSATGADMIVERFEWSEAAATPTKHGVRTLASGGSANYVNGGLAYDSNTDSHWCSVYQRGGFTVGDLFAVRLGYSGGIVEAATLYSGPNGAYSPNVTFNDDANEFAIVYGSTENPPSGYPVYAQRLQYSPNALNVLYGVGCGSGTISALTPNAGYEFFEFRMGGRPDGTAAILFLSLGPAAIPLNAFNMPGCVMNVSPAGGAFLLSVTTSVSGGLARVRMPLIDSPAFFGDIHSQWASLELGLNPANLGATRGLRTQVR